MNPQQLNARFFLASPAKNWSDGVLKYWGELRSRLPHLLTKASLRWLLFVAPLFAFSTDCLAQGGPPVITTQPQSQTAAAGYNAMFKVVVSSVTFPTYQWRKGGTPIAGETNAVFALNAAQFQDAGTYSVVVNNAVGSVTSSSATLSVESCLGTTQIFSTVGSTSDPGQPDLCGVPPSHSEFFNYLAKGSGRLTIDTTGSAFNTVVAIFRCATDCSDFADLIPVACANNSSGAGGDSVTFPATEGTRYIIVVDGVNGAAGSAVLRTKLCVSPLVSDVRDTTVNEDTSTAAIPFTIQNLGGPATDLVITSISSNTAVVPNAGIVFGGSGSNRTVTVIPASNAVGDSTITVTVTDPKGSTVSDAFVLTVNPVNDAPSFTIGPDQTVNGNSGPQTVVGWATAITAGPVNEAGQTVNFNITDNSNPGLFTAGPAVNSAGTLSYTPAANANGSATITLVMQDNGGTANGGVDTSAPRSFTITVSPSTPPQITSQPLSRTVVQGNSVTFTVVASGTAPLAYQWRLNGATISGATGASLTVINVQPSNAGNYSVMVNSTAGSVTSSNALLTVLVPPTITNQPTNQSVLRGDTVTFSVVASGTPPPLYQWRFNGANRVGATNATLTLTNVQTNNAGNYNVVVSNTAGVVTSSTATLAVGSVRLVSPQFTSTGFLFRIVGPTGSYVIQVSMNLTNWMSNRTVSVTSTSSNFVDANALTLPRRFYRVSQ